MQAGKAHWFGNQGPLEEEDYSKLELRQAVEYSGLRCECNKSYQQHWLVYISNNIKTGLQIMQVRPSLAEIRNVQGFLHKLRDDPVLFEVCD